MTTASKITMIRIFMIPVFIALFMFGNYAGNTGLEIAALLVFIVAAATDGIDGHIARSRNLVTNFGKFLDPLADKLLVTAALVALTLFVQ